MGGEWLSDLTENSSASWSLEELLDSLKSEDVELVGEDLIGTTADDDNAGGVHMGNGDKSKDFFQGSMGELLLELSSESSFSSSTMLVVWQQSSNLGLARHLREGLTIVL